MSSKPPKQIIILGAGVTGIQTALSLLTDPSSSKYKITIIASHTPGDLAPEYTSPWAGGHWRSHVGTSDADREVRDFDQRTYKFWTELLEGRANIGKGEDVGLAFRESRNFWGVENDEAAPDGSGLWWGSAVRDFQILDLEKEILQKDENGGVPEDAVFGVSYTSICIDVPKYLAWLYRTVTALGANIIKTTLDSSNGLGGIVTDAKQILLQATGTSSNASGGDIFALINCTGLSARHFLPKLEAEKLYPIRGQTLLVKGECKLARTYTHFPLDAQVNEDELTYVIPRPGSGTAILGGCKQAGNWDANVDEGLSERILERVRRWGLAEELMKRDGGFEVLSTQVGFRPGRKGGPRVEVEMRDGEEGKIEGVWVVHAYGHAGGGYQASVGSAEKVVRLLEGLP